MARLLVLKTWTVLIALLPMAGPAWATDAGPKSSAPKDARKAPPDSKDKDSKLTCLLLCQQQQLGVRLEGNDRKLFQQCFAQALCSTELGPPVVHQPPPGHSPLDPLRSPYGPLPDGRV